MGLQHSNDVGMRGQRGRARRFERGAAEQGASLERGPLRASSISDARRRGRTIWTKPKPLTAVRSKGCGRIASIASAARCRASFPAAVGRSMPIEPWRSRRRIARAAARAPATASSSAAGAVDVDQGHRPRRLDRQLATGEAHDPAAGLLDEIAPPASAEPVGGRGKGEVSSRGLRRAGRGLVGRPGERALPRFAAGDCLARDLDRQRPAFGIPGAPRGRRNSLPAGPRHGVASARAAGDQPRLHDAARAHHAVEQDPRLDDLAFVDPHRAGLADPALDEPVRQSDIRRTSAAAASLRAGARRHSNSCRRCGGHRPRHSPAAHSRRPCRAIRRGWRRSRSLPSRQPLHRDHRLDQPLADCLPGSGQSDAGQHAVPAPGQQRHAGAERRLVLDLGQDPPADRHDRVGGQHQIVGMRRGDGRAFSRASRSA